MKKKLIVFDIDGTLTDSVKIHQKAFTEALIEIGVKNFNTNFACYKHHTDSFIAKEIFELQMSEQFSESKVVEFENILTKKIRSEKIIAIKGAKKAIERIEKNADYGICYATGSLLKPAKFKLDSIGVDFNENLLIGSNAIYERENIVSKAIEKAKEIYAVNQFEKIISVGDGLWDLMTAKNLNIDFIGVGLAHKQLLEENGADFILENLTALDQNTYKLPHMND